MAPLVRRTWAPRGRTPVLYQRTSSHEKVSIIAAISVSPQRKRIGLYFPLYSSNITAPLVIRFLKQLTVHIQKPIILEWDHLLAHRAKITQKLLQRRWNLHMFFFPSYAQKLNPVEFLWSYLKSNPLANFPMYDSSTLARVARAIMLPYLSTKKNFYGLSCIPPLFFYANNRTLLIQVSIAEPAGSQALVCLC